MHGGVCHLTYLDGQARVVVAALVVPTGGEWERVVRTVRRRLPPPSQPYRPSKLRISVTAAAPHDWPAWPHAESLDLAAAVRASPVELTEPGIISSLFTHRLMSATWYFTQGGASYKITLLKVPGWYEPFDLEQVIWDLTDRGRLLPYR